MNSIVSGFCANDLEWLTFLEGQMRDLVPPRETSGGHRAAATPQPCASESPRFRPLEKMRDHWGWASRKLEQIRRDALPWPALWPTRLMTEIERGRDVGPELRAFALSVRARAHDPTRPGVRGDLPARGDLNRFVSALGAVLRARARFEALVVGVSEETKTIPISLGEHDRLEFFIDYTCEPEYERNHTRLPTRRSMPSRGSRGPQRGWSYPEFETIFWQHPRFWLLRGQERNWELGVKWTAARRDRVPVRL